MPNHVINEIIFSDISEQKRQEILGKVSGLKEKIDFGVLLPSPLNIWKGNVNSTHEAAFPGTLLDWATHNWGTKWNAYGLDEERYYPIVIAGSRLILTFQTAWSPPMGWIVALFNYFDVSFTYSWLSESGDGHMGMCVRGGNSPKWEEYELPKEMREHLYFLLFGWERKKSNV